MWGKNQIYKGGLIVDKEKKGFFSKIKEEMDKQQAIQEAKMKEKDREKQDKKIVN